MSNAFLFHSLEWASALLMLCGVWAMTTRRRYAPALGLLLFVLAVAAGVWTAWRTAHLGAVAQLAVMAALSLHGMFRGRGWALLKGGRK
jgi:hypothetical protein